MVATATTQNDVELAAALWEAIQSWMAVAHDPDTNDDYRAEILESVNTLQLRRLEVLTRVNGTN